MPVGLEEMMSTGSIDMVVVPNPVADEASVMFDLGTAGPVELDLVDVVGRRIRPIHAGILSSGIQRITLPVDGLPGGMYMVRLDP